MKLSRSLSFAAAVAAVLVVVLIGTPRAQQQSAPQNPQQPTFRTGVSAVRVDVIVTDRKGNRVDDLTADDFELSEDGAPQKIDSLKLIRVQTTEQPGGEAPREIRSFDDEATELARDDIRIIVVFLDDYHVSRVSAMRLREWLRRFIETQVGPYDVIALMYPLTPTSALTFTRDKFALASAIDKFEGRRGDYMPRNDVEANYAMEGPWTIEQIRTKVVMSALRSLSYHLGSLNEGRKSVLVVSEGLGFDATEMRELIEAANRSNVALYPLDPQGLGAATFGASDVLRSLADNTSGRAIVTRNDFEAGLGEMLRDSAGYYLLGYTSPKGADGKFHEIRVRVKRPGLEVRARKGYWAPTAEQAAAANESPRPGPSAAITTALSALAEPRGQLVRTWLGMSRGDNGRTRVTFVWERAAQGGGAASRDRLGRVLLTATADGKACFDGPVEDASVKGTEAGRAARVVFDAPPGKLHVTVTVEGAGGAAPAEVLDRAVHDVDVPNFAAAPLSISTPAVFSANTPRQFRLLSSDPTPLPTASRMFSRIDRLQLRFEVFAQAPPQSVTARLLNNNGNPMATLTPQANEQRAGEYRIDLPLANLARGEYIIEVVAKGATGEATQMVGIKVAQ